MSDRFLKACRVSSPREFVNEEPCNCSTMPPEAAGGSRSASRTRSDISNSTTARKGRCTSTARNRSSFICGFIAAAGCSAGRFAGRRLGTGSFTASKNLAFDHPDAHIDTVDSEPQLEEIARKFFRLEGASFARIVFHGQSAEEYLASSPQPCDFIFDDIFDGFQHVPLSSPARTTSGKFARR